MKELKKNKRKKGLETLEMLQLYAAYKRWHDNEIDDVNLEIEVKYNTEILK